MLTKTVVLWITSVREDPEFFLSSCLLFQSVLNVAKGVDLKRQRGDAYIYQRSTQHALHAENNTPKTSHDVVPVIHPSKPGEENVSSGDASTQKLKADTAAQAAAKVRDGVGEERAVTKLSSPTEPRRFHFSRPLITPKSLLTAGLSTGKRSRINTPTTNIFVERGHKRTRTEDVQMKDAESTHASGAAQTEEPPRKLKKPGAGRKGPSKHTVQLKKDVPPSVDKHWADNMDEITRNMNDFALHIIGESLAKTEERDRKEAAAVAKSKASSSGLTPQKYKPKPPAKRFAERHPEVAAARERATAEPRSDHEEYETASEDEYVVETYVRVPVSSLGKAVDPEKVGLLVFDTEPDAEIFYGEEGDSDDEWPEDDEDENGGPFPSPDQLKNLNANAASAENYYTADYPDDEVDSDDEYDRMAYHYRTGNASDMEEFDERDEDDVDDGDKDGNPRTSPSARLGLGPPNPFISGRGI